MIMVNRYRGDMKQLPPGQGDYIPAYPYMPHQEEVETPIGEILSRAIKGLLKRFYFIPIFLILGFSGAFVAYRLIEPRYTSTASIRIEKKSPIRDESGLGRRSLEGEIMWFTFRPVIEEMISRTGLAVLAKTPSERLALVDEFQRKRIRAFSYRDTNVVGVTGYWSEPAKAREIVATLADVFIEKYEQYNQAEMDRQTAFLSRQVADIRIQIEERQSAVSEFQKTSQILSTQDGLRSLHESLTKLEVSLGQAEMDLKSVLFQKEEIERQLGTMQGVSPVNAALVRHLTNPTSQLFIKLKEAEDHEKALALLRQQESEAAERQTETGSQYIGVISPVNESLRVSLISPESPLRQMLQRQVELDKRIKDLLVTLMPRHSTVMLAQAQLNEASASARSMIENLDPRGLELMDTLGAEGLLFQSLTWRPSPERQEIAQKKLDTLSQEIKKMIESIDPAGVKVFETYGAGHLLLQGSTWQGWGTDSSRSAEKLNETLRRLELNEEAYRNQIATLKDNIESTKRRMGNLPADQAILEGRLRELRVLEDLYVSLQQRLAAAQIEARANMWQVEVVDPPYAATRPDYPKAKVIFGFGIFAGLMLGFGLPLLLEFLHGGIQSPEEIERRLGLSVLATLPALTPQIPKSD